MSELFLAWRQPSQRWWPVGRLSREGGTFVFRYTRGALDAAQEGFRSLPSFPDLHTAYASASLFPTFANRLLAPGRSESADFVHWLGLPPSESDPLVLLGRSGGRRETDMYEVFALPVVERDGRYRLPFFVHGLRHRPDEAQRAALEVTPGDRLVLEPRPDNPEHVEAIKVLNGRSIHLGYVPRYLCRDFFALGAPQSLDISVTVHQVNPPPTPLQFRLLVSFDAPWPEGFQPFAGDEFLPLERATVTAVA